MSNQKCIPEAGCPGIGAKTIPSEQQKPPANSVSFARQLPVLILPLFSNVHCFAQVRKDTKIERSMPTLSSGLNLGPRIHDSDRTQLVGQKRHSGIFCCVRMM